MKFARRRLKLEKGSQKLEEPTSNITPLIRFDFSFGVIEAGNGEGIVRKRVRR